MKRVIAVAAAATLALLTGVGAASAEPLYPPPSEPTLEVTAESLCVGDVPYFAWEATVDEGDSTVTAADSLTITFRNPSGADHVISGQPLAGQLMWPGAAADSNGTGTDWPGWRLDNGTWVEGDEWDWTLPSVDVSFEVNPSAVINLDYPLPSAVCAGPPGPPPAGPDPDEDDDGLPDLLGLTGSQLGGALAGIAALLAAGSVLVVIRRRTQH